MGGKVRREVAHGEVVLGSRRVRYRVVRSPRARLIRLRIPADGVVEIVLPPHVPAPLPEDVLHSKLRWICRQLDRWDALPPAPRDCVRYLGTEYPVVVTRRPEGTGRAGWIDGTIHLELPPTANAIPAMEAYLREQARSVLSARVRLWSDAMEVSPGRLSVRDQRTRWGSCSSTGGLSFNWRLVMAPLVVLDYVVIHELMHLREPNHSARFWDGVAEFCPHFGQHRAWLKEQGTRLAQPLALGG